MGVREPCVADVLNCRLWLFRWCEALIELLLAQEGDIQKKIFGSRILQQFKAAWTAVEGLTCTRQTKLRRLLARS